MTLKQEETLVGANGLRYTSKQNGSPFAGLGSSGEMLSCIQCGQHRLRTKGVFKRYLHSLFFFCVNCKPETQPQG